MSGKIRLWIMLAALGAILVCPWHRLCMAGADGWPTFKIAAFNDDRSHRRFMGVSQSVVHSNLKNVDFYSTIRNALLNPVNFQIGTGTVCQTVELIGDDAGEPEVADARSYDFTGIDMLIMTEVAPLHVVDPVHYTQSDSLAEYQAIANFVRNGGCLVIAADNLTTFGPQGMEAGNGVLAALDGNSGKAGHFTGQNSTPLGGKAHGATMGEFVDWSGSNALYGAFPYYDPGIPDSPGSEVTSPDGVPFAASLHVEVATGEWSHLIGNRKTDGGSSPIMMEIPGSVFGLHPWWNWGRYKTKGNVLVIGDLILSDYYTFPGFAGWPRNVNNATILMNFVAGQTNEVPEPAILTLLVTGLLASVGLHVCRRRCNGVSEVHRTAA